MGHETWQHLDHRQNHYSNNHKVGIMAVLYCVRNDKIMFSKGHCNSDKQLLSQKAKIFMMSGMKEYVVSKLHDICAVPHETLSM